MIVIVAVGVFSSNEYNIGCFIFYVFFQMKEMLAILFIIGNPFFIACKSPKLLTLKESISNCKRYKSSREESKQEIQTLHTKTTF